MKNLEILLLVCAALFSCSSENNLKYQDATPGGDDDVSLVSCNKAIYPNQEDSEYVLPYAIGRSYQVNLGHCSSSFHAQVHQINLRLTLL